MHSGEHKAPLSSLHSYLANRVLVLTRAMETYSYRLLQAVIIVDILAQVPPRGSDCWILGHQDLEPFKPY